jgi:hypothetical protein
MTPDQLYDEFRRGETFFQVGQPAGWGWAALARTLERQGRAAEAKVPRRFAAALGVEL